MKVQFLETQLLAAATFSPLRAQCDDLTWLCSIQESFYVSQNIVDYLRDSKFKVIGSFTRDLSASFAKVLSPIANEIPHSSHMGIRLDFPRCPISLSERRKSEIPKSNETRLREICRKLCDSSIRRPKREKAHRFETRREHTANFGALPLDCKTLRGMRWIMWNLRRKTVGWVYKNRKTTVCERSICSSDVLWWDSRVWINDDMYLYLNWADKKIKYRFGNHITCRY